MSQTPSSMMPLGTEAPDFSLPEPSGGGAVRSRADVMGDKGLLVMFICNHCPFVVHIESGLHALGRDYQDSGIGIVAISANDALEYPEDAPEAMAQKRYPFAYLHDDSQQVARAYAAACTPDFFLFDSAMRCRYRGRFDGARPGNDVAVSGKDLREAMDCVAHGRSVDPEQQPSMGCNIKWRA